MNKDNACVCLCVCIYVRRHEGVKESICAVGRLAGQSVGGQRSPGNWQLRAMTHSFCREEGEQKKLQLQKGHVRERIPKNTHCGCELGQIEAAKHMTGCNKGERQREQNSGECEGLEKVSANTRATRCSAWSQV